MRVCNSLIIKLIGGGGKSLKRPLLPLLFLLCPLLAALTGCEHPAFDPLDDEDDGYTTRIDSTAADSTSTLTIIINDEWEGEKHLYF